MFTPDQNKSIPANEDFSSLYNFDHSDQSSASEADGIVHARKDEKDKDRKLLTYEFKSPIWLSVSEAAKLGGVEQKTIRRALQSRKITYKIVNDRYHIDLVSVIQYLHTNKKLKNKLNQKGIGQFVQKWKS